MKRASQVTTESCHDGFRACNELIGNLRSLRGLMGKPEKRRSYNHLKSIGTAIILAPSPEPFTDLIGLALIGLAKGAEKHKPPLTICEMGEEGRSIFKGLGSYTLLR